jgi:hypothetical protein
MELTGSQVRVNDLYDFAPVGYLTRVANWPGRSVGNNHEETERESVKYRVGYLSPKEPPWQKDSS